MNYWVEKWINNENGADKKLTENPKYNLFIYYCLLKLFSHIKKKYFSKKTIIIHKYENNANI